MIKYVTKVIEYKFVIHNKITYFVTRSFKGYNKKYSHNRLIFSTCKILNPARVLLLQKNYYPFSAPSAISHRSSNGSISISIV